MDAKSLFYNAPQHRSVAAGEVIYREGEPGTHMYGIVSGSVELRKSDVTVAHLGENDVFGERALIENKPRGVTAVAVTDTVLADIDRRLFLFLVDVTPTFALDIMGALAKRLDAYDDLFGSASVGAAAR
jgi:CRP-like cAMP-binding protein